MGNWCGSCCRWCYRCCFPEVDKSAQVSRATSGQSAETTTIPVTVRHFGTSPIQVEVKSVGVSVKIKTPPPLPPASIPVTPGFQTIPKTSLDTSSLDGFTSYIDFSEEINEPIEFDSIENKLSSRKKTESTKKKPPPKKPQDISNWNEKYFLHGELSDIVADINSKTQGYINSSISEDIDEVLSLLYDIDTKQGENFKKRSAKIFVKEKKLIEKCILKRDELIGKLTSQGRSYGDQYEEQYRLILEEFIKKLEINLSKHLDYLHEQISAEKTTVFLKTNDNIKKITEKAGEAKIEIYILEENAGNKSREEVIRKVTDIYKEKTNQSLGYEQLRTLKLKVYSNVGITEGELGRNVTPDGENLIQFINNARPYQPQTKRTVYLQSDITRMQS